MATWILAALRLAPLIVGAIQSAEDRHAAPGSGTAKRDEVLNLVEPVARQAVPAERGDIRQAVSLTIDAVVQWMKVFGAL